MRGAALTTTWGPPLLARTAEPRDSVPPVVTPSIQEELHDCLQREIADWQPKLVIAIERRGTAILRALKEAPGHRLPLPWANVISSHVLDQLTPDCLQNKRILVFDDMKKGGSHINHVLETFSAMPGSEDVLRNVRVAVFALHEDATRRASFPDYGVRESWFYRGLTTAAYRNKRLAILAMLQRAGSLMLDTEHLEVRVRLRGTFSQFLEALGRRARAITFHSLGNRRNITVYYEDNDAAHQLSPDCYPEGSQTTDIVKKCRAVERGPDEFALIPICYPAIPERCGDWPRRAEDAALLGAALGRSSTARCYGSALLSALDVLGWVLKALSAAGPKLSSVYLPTVSSPEREGEGASLNHLSVMYPTVELRQLAKRVEAIDAEASHDGALLRGQQVTPTPEVRVRDEDLRNDAWALLQVICYVLDRRAQEEWLFDPAWRRPHPFGLTAEEFFRLGDRLGWQRVHTSSLCDLLIDDGHIVTHVASNTARDGVVYVERVFEPDGEMVSELVRTYTIQRGLPNGF